MMTVLRHPMWPTTLTVVAIVLLPALIGRSVDWLLVWPTTWTIPATEWIGVTVGAALDVIRPVARVLAGFFQLLLDGANWVLTQTHWTAVFGVFLALAWWVGGRGMALFTAACLAFILFSGYWAESMSTLGLLVVSVPLAVSLGLAIGVLAFEMKAVRKAVETVLDVMQTIPTFAYLTPLLILFGFGPVVGLLASAIYAAPPMARNVLLGLERIEPEIREAAIMAGTRRWQRIIMVDIPSAMPQILVGINQCVMAALSMVIIAAVIGGFDDIGWEVLLTMRKAQFGQALLAGLVIVIFAILIDRMSTRYATTPTRGNVRWAVIIAGAGIAISVPSLIWNLLPDSTAFNLLDPAVTFVDAQLTAFTQANGAALDSLKNGAMFYGMLPVRIGLDDSVLPFTWGFSWTADHSFWMLATVGLMSAALVFSGRHVLGLFVLCAGLVVHTGVTNLPWPSVIGLIAFIAWRAGGVGLAAFVGLALGIIMISGLWDRAMLSIYLCGTAVVICATLGGTIGLISAMSPTAWRFVQPVCDMLQTIPLFVFLIPVLMFFQIGEFSALLAICAYAIVPIIRYTRHGIISTPDRLMEAAIASGATSGQIMLHVRIPYAVPTILLGLNQTILYAFAMLVIAALIGTTGLGQSIYIALGNADIGLGIAAGAAMALLALIADRLVQAFAEERRRSLIA